MGGVWSTDDLLDNDNGRNHQRICDRYQAMDVLSVVMQEIKYARNSKRDEQIQQYACSDATLRTKTITPMKNIRGGQAHKAITNFRQQVP